MEFLFAHFCVFMSLKLLTFLKTSRNTDAEKYHIRLGAVAWTLGIKLNILFLLALCSIGK